MLRSLRSKAPATTMETTPETDTTLIDRLSTQLEASKKEVSVLVETHRHQSMLFATEEKKQLENLARLQLLLTSVREQIKSTTRSVALTVDVADDVTQPESGETTHGSGASTPYLLSSQKSMDDQNDDQLGLVKEEGTGDLVSIRGRMKTMEAKIVSIVEDISRTVAKQAAISRKLAFTSEDNMEEHFYHAAFMNEKSVSNDDVMINACTSLDENLTNQIRQLHSLFSLKELPLPEDSRNQAEDCGCYDFSPFSPRPGRTSMPIISPLDERIRTLETKLMFALESVLQAAEGRLSDDAEARCELIAHQERVILVCAKATEEAKQTIQNLQQQLQDAHREMEVLTAQIAPLQQTLATTRRAINKQRLKADMAGDALELCGDKLFQCLYSVEENHTGDVPGGVPGGLPGDMTGGLHGDVNGGLHGGLTGGLPQGFSPTDYRCLLTAIEELHQRYMNHEEMLCEVHDHELNEMLEELRLSRRRNKALKELLRENREEYHTLDASKGLLLTDITTLHHELQSDRTIAIAASAELSRQYSVRNEDLEQQMSALTTSLSQQTQRAIAAEQREKILASELTKRATQASVLQVMRSSLLASTPTTPNPSRQPSQGHPEEKEEEHRCDDSDVVGTSHENVSLRGGLLGSSVATSGTGNGTGNGSGSGELSSVKLAGVRALLHQSTLLADVPIKEWSNLSVTEREIMLEQLATLRKSVNRSIDDAAESGDIVSADLCFEIEDRLNQVENRLLLSPLATNTKLSMDRQCVAIDTTTTDTTTTTTTDAATTSNNSHTTTATGNNHAGNNGNDICNSNTATTTIGGTITTTATHDEDNEDAMYSRPPLLRQQSLREIPIYCQDDNYDGSA